MTFRRRGVDLYSRRRRGELRIELKNGSAATAEDRTRRRQEARRTNALPLEMKRHKRGKPYRDYVSFLTRTYRPPFGGGSTVFSMGGGAH